MSFGGNIWSANCIDCFERAESYFNGTPQPRGKKWEDSTRPLASNRQPHMAVERISADTYGINLYYKRVIQYHRPKDGTRTSEYFATYHQATWAWLWRHGSMGYGNKMETTDGRTVLIPIGSGDHTIITTRERSREVITELSHHPQIWTKASTEEDKAKRVQLKKKVEIAVEMALHTLVWKEKVVVRVSAYYAYTKGVKGAFDSMLPSANSSLERSLKFAMGNIVDSLDEPLNEDEIGPIIEAANVAYNYYEEQPPIDAFRKNYTQYLIRVAKLDAQSGKKLYPMFPDYDSVPKKFFLR